MTQRVESAIRCQPLGAVLTCSNVGYQRVRSPKLVLDAVMDFYEELWSDSSRCLTHVPWDFRSFFDEAHPCVADAVMKARGVPEAGRRWFVEVHSAEASLCAFTPWGLTPPVQRAIGLHQGSTSGPLLSRFVGEIPARLVDKHPSPAFIGAVPTAQLSAADDGNAFCEGVGAGQLAADALSLGCVSCGLGVDVKQGGRLHKWSHRCASCLPHRATGQRATRHLPVAKASIANAPPGGVFDLGCWPCSVRGRP